MEKLFDVVIVANGQSVRTGFQKLSAEIGEKTVLSHAVHAFRSVSTIKNIIVVTDRAEIVPLEKNIVIVAGGDTRTASVRQGLHAVTAPYVLIHDGARPFPSPALIERVMECTEKNRSGIPYLPITDSVKQRKNGTVSASPDRTDFVTVQTPQGFLTEEIVQAYAALPLSAAPTDDSEVYRRYISPPFLVEGARENLKITYPEDIFGLNAETGCGFDVHETEQGKPLRLGGITVPAPFGLRAHSDGDVVLHAVMDALLSLAGERDIGVQFPDSDPTYCGIDSTELLQLVSDRLNLNGVTVTSISVTILAERPRLSPFLPAMQEQMAAVLGITPSLIRISVTTTETLGIIGNGTGIAALALASGYRMERK